MTKLPKKFSKQQKLPKSCQATLWPRLGKIRFLDVAHFKIQMLTNLTIHSAFCFAFFQGLVMKYRLEMTNRKDAPGQCKYRLAWDKSNVFTRANRKLKQGRRRRQRERQKTQYVQIGKQQLCTCITLFIVHSFAFTARLRRESATFLVLWRT